MSWMKLCQAYLLPNNPLNELPWLLEPDGQRPGGGDQLDASVGIIVYIALIGSGKFLDKIVDIRRHHCKGNDGGWLQA